MSDLILVYDQYIAHNTYRSSAMPAKAIVLERS